MITTVYVRTLAAYNAEMNRRVYEAAGRLPDDERKRDRNAALRSIHGTLSHLVWADRMWMSRFDGWTASPVVLRDSDSLYEHVEAMAATRIEDDRRIEARAAGLEPGWPS